jgi:hypothetical protein
LKIAAVQKFKVQPFKEKGILGIFDFKKYGPDG